MLPNFACGFPSRRNLSFTFIAPIVILGPTPENWLFPSHWLECDHYNSYSSTELCCDGVVHVCCGVQIADNYAGRCVVLFHCDYFSASICHIEELYVRSWYEYTWIFLLSLGSVYYRPMELLRKFLLIRVVRNTVSSRTCSVVLLSSKIRYFGTQCRLFAKSFVIPDLSLLYVYSCITKSNLIFKSQLFTQIWRLEFLRQNVKSQVKFSQANLRS